MPPVGLAIGHPANAALLDFLRSPEFTPELVRQRLTRAASGQPPSEDKLAALLAKMRATPKLPDEPSAPFPVDMKDLMALGGRLGTHPDLIERLFLLNRLLDEDCRWTIHRRLALVHPRSGIAFAFAFGTIGYALRLPPPELAAAVAAGAGPLPKSGDPTHDIAALGPGWVYGVWHPDEPGWCHAGYKAAGSVA